MSLNKAAQQWVLRPKGPSTVLIVSPTLKEALDKVIKPPPSSVKWYKLDN